MERSKYPSYPSSNWDYSVKESARAALNPPNKCICLYCHKQAKTEKEIKHQKDCPTLK